MVKSARSDRSGAAGALVALLLLAACSTATPAGPSPTGLASGEPSGSSEPEPTQEPTATASVQPLDPDGNHVATGLAISRHVSADSPLTEIFLVEADGNLRQVTGLEAGESVGGAAPVWSPDGTMIAFGPSALGGALPALHLVNADGTGQHLVQQFDVEEFSRAAWSADGRYLLFADATPPGDRRLWLYDGETGEVVRIGTGSSPQWIPGSDRIAFVNGVAGLVAGDPEALTLVVFTMALNDLQPVDYARADAAYWSPTGDAVLLEQDGLLILTDVDGSNRRELAEGGQAAWSPDGTRFAFLSGHDADGSPLVAVMDRDGQELWTGVVGSMPAWSADGSRLAVDVTYPDQVVRVLDAASGEQLWETEGGHPAWRP